ncbi:MAG: OmpA family protein, partial [Paraprevotella sp.]|nr:OmpA family protein [Paraprevotella sp.]
NIFAGYKGSPRLFEVEAVGGFGWLHLSDFYAGTLDDANHLAAKAGVNFNFNVGEQKAWTIAIKPAILWDMSMWDAGVKNTHPNFNANYANWEITAGVVYHFKNSNGKHYMTKVKAYDPAEISDLNATINTLRQEANAKDERLKSTENRLRNEEQKSADLEKALNDCRNQGPKVITNNNKTMESVVTFRQGKIVIDASQQPNVERIATYLKNHKDVKVNVLGYASPEGSAEVNTRIANQRAEAVKNMLVNKYRIDANRITAKGQGVGYMFEEPDWNRVSICTIVED